MITEAMWDQVNNISMIANVLLNAVLVSVFYIPFLRRRVRTVILVIKGNYTEILVTLLVTTASRYNQKYM